ncbi:MAG: cyclase, partial [Ramlibacter sp.]|nr:cyclase [Ramlibacter sp.]
MLGKIVTVAALATAGVLLSKKLRGTPIGGGASIIEVSCEVDVPVQTAYNQWTQFEDFPRFKRNVLEVRQIDDEHLHWRATVGGKEMEWDAEIVEQLPDQVIAWRSTS